MKKIRKTLLGTLLLVVFTLVLGCGDSSVEPVVISVSGVSENVTLIQYMTDNDVNYKSENGMITEINGTKNSTNCYWMLYTSDTQNANTAWGEYKYNDQTLGSATLGAGELIVKNDHVYVWVYQKF